MKTLIFRIVILPILCGLCMVAAGAQQPPAPNPVPAREETARPPARDDDYRRSGVHVSPDEDYKIGAGDVIDIKVADADELSGVYRVSADGTIKLRFLGRILALDKTPEELAKTITDGLQGKYLFDPRVDVIVREYNSRMIYIQGAVGRPGVYQMEGRPNLLQLIVLAGGLSQNFGSTAFIIRRVKIPDAERRAQEASLKEQNAQPQEAKTDASDADPDRPRLTDAEWLARQYTLIKLNINGLFKGRFDQNMFLEPGDVVTIPPTDLFFMTGQLKAPGSFPLKEGTSLRQAVALAQGFTPTASPGKSIIFRENPETGKRLELNVDLGEIMSGKKEDMLVYPNDVIVVPASGFKTFAIPAIQTATFSVLTTLLLRVFF
ncbi:MAG: polysaccharide biosynthesis/export family protein [Acidobacteria bacterium]|nr:polysaccharide biosynthesis/export family protein [Acidobacteriota bacterium]